MIDLNDVAERVFASFVAHDLDAIEAMMATGATITQNGVTSVFAEAKPRLARIPSVIGNHHYENVRRSIGPNFVVEEHDVVTTTPSGVHLNIAACVVLRVDQEGRIISLDEYLDTASMR